MKIVILPAKYKNTGEMFNSPEFIAFKEKCLKYYQTRRNKQCVSNLVIKLPGGKITFSAVENINDFFANIPIGGSVVGLQGESKITYYSPVNTIMRFCILTELTKYICQN